MRLILSGSLVLIAAWACACSGGSKLGPVSDATVTLTLDGSTCNVTAPAAATSEQLTALTAVNTARAAAGIVCASEDPFLNAAATRHCTYYSSNTGSCISDAHTEVASCKNYVAAQFWDRDKAAGYTAGAVFEDMAFSENAQSAVTQWIDSVWHRTPILSPWIVQIGYGQAARCDTMDFGGGGSHMSDQTIATYPYGGQTGVPLSYNGTYEGPTPPAPPSGWPSGYPVTVFVKGTVSSHSITVDGSTTPIAHQWIDTSNDSMGLLESSAVVMYTDTPLTKNTTYHVVVSGTLTSGSATFSADFKFTTSAQ